MSTVFDPEWLPLERHMIVGLKPGDVLRRWKTGVWHLGIYLGDGKVLHNVPGDSVGERLTSYRTFASGKDVQVARGNPTLRAEVMQRATEILANPRAYSYIWRNCEHTAYEIMEGQPRSPTVQRVNGVLSMMVVVSLTALAYNFRREIGSGLRRLGRGS